MVGQKLVIGFLLLLTAVPAGCLPPVAVAGIREELAPADVRTVRGRPVPSPRSRTTGVIFIAIILGFALFLNWLVWRMFVRVRNLGEATWMGLGGGAWRHLLFIAYGMGLECGILMFQM